MTERVTDRSIVFEHAFHLPGADGMQPAGVYRIETREEQIDGLSFVAWRRVSTTIEVRGATAASRQLIAVEPGDIERALNNDARTSDESA